MHTCSVSACLMYSPCAHVFGVCMFDVCIMCTRVRCRDGGGGLSHFLTCLRATCRLVGRLLNAGLLTDEAMLFPNNQLSAVGDRPQSGSIRH